MIITPTPTTPTVRASLIAAAERKAAKNAEQNRILSDAWDKILRGVSPVEDFKGLRQLLVEMDEQRRTVDITKATDEQAKSLGFADVAEAVKFIQEQPAILGYTPPPFSPDAKGYVGTYLTNIDDLKEVFRTKNADYGHAVLITYYLFGVEGLLQRLWDKLLRCTSINAKGVSLVAEKMSETLTDMGNYALIARAIIEAYPDRTSEELKKAFMQAMLDMQTGREVGNSEESFTD